MIALLAMTLLSAAPEAAPVAEVPGLEKTLRWGAAPNEVAEQFTDLKWTKGSATEEGLAQAEASTKVASRDARLTFQFIKKQLATIAVRFDPKTASADNDFMALESIIQTKGY